MGELLGLNALSVVVGLCVLAFSVARLSLKLLFGLLFLSICALTWLVVLPVMRNKAMFACSPLWCSCR
jgi:hypothetical protein